MKIKNKLKDDLHYESKNSFNILLIGGCVNMENLLNQKQKLLSVRQGNIKTND